MQLKEYQETLPARQEFEMLARQLEDYGSPLSETQRKSLVDVVIEERKRVPMPAYVDGMDQVEYAKAVNDWKNDYDKRIADEADRILNIEQMTAYNEIQQLQKDMREQFAASGIAIAGPAGPGGSMRRMGYVNSVAVTTAAPVNAAGAAVNTIVVTKEEQKKP